MAETEKIEKYDNLREDELSEKSNEIVYAKNDIMNTVIKRCRGKKKTTTTTKKTKTRGEREYTDPERM